MDVPEKVSPMRRFFLCGISWKREAEIRPAVCQIVFRDGRDNYDE